MDSARPFLIPLDKVREEDEQIVGGKAVKLGLLAQAGFAVPQGFCVTTWAYRSICQRTQDHRRNSDGIGAQVDGGYAVGRDLGRVAADSINISRPTAGECSRARQSRKVWNDFNLPASLAVRSSAIGEDSAGCSFAGLHESILGVTGRKGIEDAVRLVWASLWSDAALLYRKELGLDPIHSRMAVLVQEMVHADRSGVAFGRDPRDISKDHAIIESVPGPCSLLVDGVVDPDRWELSRQTGRVIAWLPGERADAEENTPLLAPCDLEEILDTVLSVERLFRWPADMEWTGRADSLTVLQARPITTSEPDDDETRSWYLTLRPGDARLKELRKRVVEELIPQLAAEGEALAAEDLDLLDDRQLAEAIEHRSEVVAKWKKIYWDEFIPFAHGVRRLATYYNDAVQPDDPYEFVGLLRDQPLLAAQRNQSIVELARQLAANDVLRRNVEAMLAQHATALQWTIFRNELLRTGDEAERFVRGFDELSDRFLDIAYDDERLRDQPEAVLRNLVELSRSPNQSTEDEPQRNSVAFLENRLLTSVGSERRDEAMDVIETGRVSWKLRDDDNLLVARLESQLLRAVAVAAKRLRDSGRLIVDGYLNESHAQTLVRALREPSSRSNHDRDADEIP